MVRGLFVGVACLLLREEIVSAFHSLSSSPRTDLEATIQWNHAKKREDPWQRISTPQRSIGNVPPPPTALRWTTVKAHSSSSGRSSISSHAARRLEVQDHSVLLSSGVPMQVLTQQPRAPPPPQEIQRKPVLLFLHGSFHAAWCWAEHWFEYFAAQNYPVAALSWRGTGGTPAGDGVKKVPIRDHVQDLHELLTQHLLHLVSSPSSDESSTPAAYDVVLVSHSFGGLVIMKLLEAHPELLQPSSTHIFSSDQAETGTKPSIHLRGIVTCCSVPPSGNGPMTMRYLKRSLKASWKITAGLAMKKVLTDANLCRELFFTTNGKDNFNTDDLSDDDLLRYQRYFARDSVATIDLLDLAKQLPSASTDALRRAPFVNELPPCLVVGATHDYIVDALGVQETAQYYGLDGPLWVNSPHDIMLSRHWMQGADALAQWLSTNVS